MHFEDNAMPWAACFDKPTLSLFGVLQIRSSAVWAYIPAPFWLDVAKQQSQTATLVTVSADLCPSAAAAAFECCL